MSKINKTFQSTCTKSLLFFVFNLFFMPRHKDQTLGKVVFCQPDCLGVHFRPGKSLPGTTRVGPALSSLRCPEPPCLGVNENPFCQGRLTPLRSVDLRAAAGLPATEKTKTPSGTRFYPIRQAYENKFSTLAGLDKIRLLRSFSFFSVAEKGRFELPIPFWGIRTFQARTFSHSVISPDTGLFFFKTAAKYTKKIRPANNLWGNFSPDGPF